LHKKIKDVLKCRQTASPHSATSGLTQEHVFNANVWWKKWAYSLRIFEGRIG
jgi:hypothetical protein